VTADGGDYTVHIVVGIDVEGRLYLLDLWRAQTSSDRWVEAFCDLVNEWKPMGWAEESGQIKAGVGPFLEKRMRQRNAFVARDLPDARRQGHPGAVDPRPNGARWSLRADQCALV
jgi:hypothetical protein